ncbi:MAG: zinc ribbon domain-containing protein [Bacteroidetes bacterium QH_10_64_19]|nr:MAG: zinc ribbon domain-containing protein [Bacteroidetes bacterium QH_10_64_19]
MSADPQTCPSCGAQVSPDADRCELCGTPVAADDESGDEEEPAPDRSESDSEDGPSVFCNQCGWENPPGARYCSRCGEALQDLSDASPAGTRRVAADLPTGTTSTDSGAAEAAPSTDTEEAPEDQAPEDQGADEQAAMGRQIMLVVGGALAVVLGLFFVTQWSAQYEWADDTSSDASAAQAETGGSGATSGPSSGGQGGMRAPGQGGEQAEPADLRGLLDRTADPIAGAMAGQIDSLETQIEQASGAEKQQLQTELVNLYIGAGHPGRAAVVQQELADARGTVEAQRRAADLLYRWMQKVQGQGDRKQVFRVARHAAQAYEAVVEKKPDDLDARTRMGETYLLTNEPMRGIKAINAVLDDDSTFVPARFQKGLALLQINRLDQAVRQFEMVQQYAEEGSPFSRQADRALKAIEEQRSQSSSGGSPAGPDS